MEGSPPAPAARTSCRRLPLTAQRILFGPILSSPLVATERILARPFSGRAGIGAPVPWCRLAAMTHLSHGRTELTMNARLTLKTRLRLAAVAAIMIPAAAIASPALAHDALSSTSPAQDSVATTAPETVTLTLSEPPANSENLNLSTITVTDGAGKTVSDGKVTVYGPTLSTTLDPGTAGTYTVLWRTVSSDGHPIEGKYSFTVQPAVGAGAPAPSAAPTASPSAAPSAATAPAPTQVPPPNNDNAPLVLGISAAILAAAIGTGLVLRNRRNNPKP